MRKWVWLAATAATILATPVMARDTTRPVAGVSDDERAIAAGVDKAATRMDADDEKGAEPDLKALIASPHFAGASTLTQARALTLLGICESVDGEPDAGLQHLIQAGKTNPDVRDRTYWVELAFVAYDLHKDELTGEAFSNTVVADPERAGALSPGLIYETLRRLQKLQDGGAHRRQLLEALTTAGYDPGDDPTAGETIRRDLFEVYAEAGEDAKARALLPDLVEPDTIVALRADNRYRRLVVDNPDFNNFAAMQDRYIEILRNRQASGGLPYAQALALSLMTANRLPEALKVVDNALAIGDLAAGAHSDQGDQTKWLLDTRTRILALMGRWDEVEAAQVKARDSALKEGVDLVSQKINLADLYNRLGRPQDALKELSDLHDDKASVYGQMVAEQVRACAYAGLGDKDKLKASLDIIRAHAGEARDLLASSLTCAGDEDAVAALTIARLDDPAQRNDELVNDQDYLPAPHPTAYDAAYDMHFRNVLKRPDVQAAIAKYGVVESYPAFPPEN